MPRAGARRWKRAVPCGRGVPGAVASSRPRGGRSLLRDTQHDAAAGGGLRSPWKTTPRQSRTSSRRTGTRRGQLRWRWALPACSSRSRGPASTCRPQPKRQRLDRTSCRATPAPLPARTAPITRRSREPPAPPTGSCTRTTTPARASRRSIGSTPRTCRGSRRPASSRWGARQLPDRPPRARRHDVPDDVEEHHRARRGELPREVAAHVEAAR